MSLTPAGGPEHIYHLRNTNSHYAATESLNTLTYETKKSSSQIKRPALAFSAVLLCSLSVCVSSGSATPQRFIAQHTNGLPGFILRLQESALPPNNILPRTTSAERCRQQAGLLLRTHRSVKGKHTFVKLGNPQQG